VSIARFLLRHLRRSKLHQSNVLLQTTARVHDELPALAGYRHLLVTDLPEEIGSFARRLFQCLFELPRGEPRFMRLAQCILRTEESIGRDEPTDSLVRAKEVVVRDEVRETLARIREILRLHALPKLTPDRLPQTLALADRLGMMRACNDMTDPFAHEHALKFALAAPSEVLPALVGKHLLGFAKARDAVHQGLDHEIRTLMRREAEAHDETAEIVDESDQVDARRVAREQEACDVRLPQIACVCALEAPRQRRFLPHTRS
jgi:hypothetical protein